MDTSNGVESNANFKYIPLFPTKSASLLVSDVVLYFESTAHSDYTDAARGAVVSIQTRVDSDGDEDATIVLNKDSIVTSLLDYDVSP